MKNTLRKVSWVSALGFALAALVQFAGFVAIPGVPTAALVGGFLGSVVLAFVLGDYSQKPAFRVRRTAESADACPTVNRPANSGPDWTYTTRSK